MITQRQENILNTLIQEYINTAKPVSSELLERKHNFEFCPATIRNEMKKLTEMGYLEQPHTSAGRMPTKKAYRYFAIKIESEGGDDLEKFIEHQICFVQKEIEREIKMAEEIVESLKNDDIFEIFNILDTWHKKTKN